MLTELAPRLDREVDPLWISRQSLETASDAMKPGGWLAACRLDVRAGMRKSVAHR